MPARLVFAMQNNEKQGDEQGICTAASLLWAKRCLELRRGIGSYAELGADDHLINGQMAVIRRLDNNPAEQCQFFGLNTPGDQAVATLNAVYGNMPAAPSVCIFWNPYHTMGFWRGTAQQGFDFFDKNHGLYTDATVAELVAIYNAHYPGAGDQIIGMRVVTLR